jgi:hypothetical protein
VKVAVVKRRYPNEPIRVPCPVLLQSVCKSNRSTHHRSFEWPKISSMMIHMTNVSPCAIEKVFPDLAVLVWKIAVVPNEASEDEPRVEHKVMNLILRTRHPRISA